MPAITYDFRIEQGATFALKFAKKDQAGTPIALTSYTARMQVRSSVASPDVMLELTTANNRLVIDEAAGIVAINLLATDTADITWRKGVYDLELEAPDGTVTRLVEGVITISREVTR